MMKGQTLIKKRRWSDEAVRKNKKLHSKKIKSGWYAGCQQKGEENRLLIVNKVSEVIEHENAEIVDQDISTQTNDINYSKSTNTSRTSDLFFKRPEAIGKISKKGSTNKA